MSLYNRLLCWYNKRTEFIEILDRGTEGGLQSKNEEERMEQLTFGEQLKVVLSRRGMTIKALAERIEKHTGKNMSRQNLTQRIGRDNFQEQDMRMIAEILECPFTLNILTTEELFDELTVKKASEGFAPKLDEGIEIFEEEFEDEEVESEELLEESEELQEEGKELQESSEELREELQDNSEELQEELEVIQEEFIFEEASDASDEIVLKTKPTEPTKVKEENLITVGDLRDMNQELSDLEREAEFRARGIFLRVKGVDINHSKTESKGEEISAERELGGTKEIPQVELAEREETVPLGDINPHTGKEYETNSVRTHPTRIGYVQVYDRGIHRWKDMTEWAFLGYQERKKAILGSRYEEPIYLD